MTDNRKQMTDDGSRMTDYGRQMSDDGCQETDDRKQMTEARGSDDGNTVGSRMLFAIGYPIVEYKFQTLNSILFLYASQLPKARLHREL